MSNYSSSDSDSDYGYDLSAEDEGQLSLLADAPAAPLASPPGRSIARTRPAPQAAPSIATIASLETISDGSSRVNDAALDPGFAYAYEPQLLVGDARVPFFDGGRAASVGSQTLADKDRLRSAPEYHTGGGDVSYPDCMYCWSMPLSPTD